MPMSTSGLIFLMRRRLPSVPIDFAAAGAEDEDAEFRAGVMRDPEREMRREGKHDSSSASRASRRRRSSRARRRA